MPTLPRLLLAMVSSAGLAVAAMASAAPAAGGSDEAKTFRDNVSRWTSEDGRYVEAWWDANLDADAKLERIALLCDVVGDEKKAVLLIEKDAGHRWELAFDVDARSKVCHARPAAEPTWEHRKTTTVEFEQPRHDGYSKTSFALRVGQPVIVREEEVADANVDPKPVVKDWDLLIKKKKEKNYQLPEQLKAFKR